MSCVERRCHRFPLTCFSRVLHCSRIQQANLQPVHLAALLRRRRRRHLLVRGTLVRKLPLETLGAATSPQPLFPSQHPMLPVLPPRLHLLLAKNGNRSASGKPFSLWPDTEVNTGKCQGFQSAGRIAGVGVAMPSGRWPVCFLVEAHRTSREVRAALFVLDAVVVCHR